MDSIDVLEEIREARQTELSRLGSSKSLFADTDGDLEPEPVLTAAADTFSAAAEVVEPWADDGGEEFVRTAASTQRDAYETVVDELGSHDGGEAPAVSAALDAVDAPAERLGALVGWTLVVRKKTNQLTGFFTGRADPATAGVFREIGEALDDLLADGADALDGLAETDRETAIAAADAVIEAAYEEYVDRLEAQGVNPKPVC